MRRLGFVLVLTLVLAGCTGSDDGPGAGGSGDVVTSNETTTIPVSVQVADPTGGAPGAAGEVDVEEGATALVAEARWACASPVCEFDLVVLDANGTELARADGTGSARVNVTAPPAGTLAVQLVPAGPSANVEGEIRATVFYGSAPAEGFTAFPEDARRHSAA